MVGDARGWVARGGEKVEAEAEESGGGGGDGYANNC